MSLITAPPAAADGPSDFTNPNGITINHTGPATPYASENQVAGMNGVITDLRVRIGSLSHTFPDDVNILLVSPAGKKVLLMADVGGDTDAAGTSVTFRDTFPAAPDNTPLVDGATYSPTNGGATSPDCNDSDAFPAPAPGGPYGSTLSTTYGDKPNGTWKLFVVDDCSQDSGSINSWRLRITTAPGNQTITWNPPATGAVGTTHQADATGGPSGQPVTYSLGGGTTNNACTVSPTGLITYLHVGNCNVLADQAGNIDYNAAPQVSRNITVVKGTQNIVFSTANPSPVGIGDTYDADADSNPGSVNPVTFSVGGLTTNNACTVNNITGFVTFNHAGTCEVAANQAGDEDWHPAIQVSQIITVSKTAQSINFTSAPPAQPTVGNTYQVTATGGGSGNPVTFSVGGGTTNGACTVTSGGLVTFQAVGNCQIAADQAGNADYAAAPTAFQNVGTVKQGQQIDNSQIPKTGFKGMSIQLNVSGGGSGNPVTIVTTTPGKCTVSADMKTLTYTNTGTCTLQLNQAGNSQYWPAPQVTHHIQVYGGF